MRAHERRRREAVLRNAAEIRDRQAEALGIDDPQTYRLTIIPAYRAPITNLPERRRRAFRDTLNRLIGAASAHRTGPPPGAAGPPSGPGPADAPVPEVHAVLGRACALCQGGCCAHGGEHAYLTAETLRRYMEQHPDRRPRGVLADYLGRVGHRTVEGSCIFHGPDGCGLPREMRSDTCNRHLCPSLREFSGCLPRPGPVRGFFVATTGGAIRGAAFCDASASRVVSPPPASDRES